MVYSRSTIMSRICDAVVVVWAAGSRVSGSIPIAMVRVPPCLGPEVLVVLVPPLPHATTVTPSATSSASFRIGICSLLRPKGSNEYMAALSARRGPNLIGQPPRQRVQQLLADGGVCAH